MTRARDRWTWKRWLKWTSLAACITLILAWAVSLVWLGECGYYESSPTDRVPPESRLCAIRMVPHGFILDKQSSLVWPWTGAYFRALSPGSNTRLWLPRRDTSPTGFTCRIPFWLLLLPAAATTTLLWWRDRSPRSGCKQCGYSLTGLPAATPCPECGTQPSPLPPP